MNYKMILIISSGVFLACAGCKSTANQSAENQPVAKQAADNPAVPAKITSKRVYDTSYIPRSLSAKVNADGTGYINKPIVVNELLIDGKVIYEVINNGTSTYYNVGGTELAGAERTRVLSQVKTPSVTR